jgi:tRNA dimethylallyltransferase
MSKPKVVTIVGPTASGKTAVGVKLAKKFSGEIVSADSRQVFRGLDLGTGKDLAEYDGVRYHLIDVAEPGEDFNLFKYLKLARSAVKDILKRGKLPIIVGGTGLYIQGLAEGFELESSQSVISEKYSREQLSNLSTEQLQNILKEIDLASFENLADPKNPHRLIRAIERVQEGLSMEKKKPEWDVLQIGLEWPREELNKRIDKRADDRFKQGMLSEAESLLKSGVNPDWLLNLGLEYRLMTSFLISNDKFLISNQIPRPKFEFTTYRSCDEMVNDLKLKSHQYAKRQMTWFKRFPEVVWRKEYSEIERMVRKYIES